MYTQLAIDILQSAELNLPNDVLPPKLPYPPTSPVSIKQLKGNSPTGTIRLTHQEPLWLCVCRSPHCRVKKRTRSFTVTQMCKMSGTFKHVCVHRCMISVQNISEMKLARMFSWESISALCSTDRVLDLHL